MNQNKTRMECDFSVMGIDPGIGVTGYGIVHSKGSQLISVDFGSIKTRASESIAARLQFLHEELSKVMDLFKPEQVAIEEVFAAHNISSAFKLGQARGVALMTAFSCGAEIGEYSALHVKKAVVGVGRATKEQVQLMVQHLLKLPEKPKPFDAADALAIAICHIHTLRSRWPKDIHSVNRRNA